MSEKLKSIRKVVGEKFHQLRNIKFVNGEFPLTLREELSVYYNMLWHGRIPHETLDKPDSTRIDYIKLDDAGSEDLQTERDRLYSQVDGLLNREIFGEERALDVENRIKNRLHIITLEQINYLSAESSCQDVDRLKKIETISRTAAELQGMESILEIIDERAANKLQVIISNAVIMGISQVVDTIK